MTTQIPELLIPAGTYRKLQVALKYGADAVYVGASGFSMRPDKASFAGDELHQAVEYVHAKGKKIYIGINSLIMQDELNALREWLEETKHIPFDALIVADPGALMLVRQTRPDVEIHISTQLSTANALSVEFWKEAGANRVVLARECSLKETKTIVQDSSLPVEVFVHGTMCMAVSGRCLLSHHLTGHNASKGDCKNTCRWQWELKESKRPNESFPFIETEKNTVFFGSKDLCLLEHIPDVIQSGAASLKIEGRMKSEYYVAAITRTYRAALDAYANEPENYKISPEWMVDVNSVRHHPYSTGFAFGYSSDDPETLQASQVEAGNYDFVGVTESIDENSLYVDVKNPITVNETLEWIGPQSQGGIFTVQSIVDASNACIGRASSGRKVRLFVENGVPFGSHIVLRRLKKGKESNPVLL